MPICWDETALTYLCVCMRCANVYDYAHVRVRSGEVGGNRRLMSRSVWERKDLMSINLHKLGPKGLLALHPSVPPSFSLPFCLSATHTHNDSLSYSPLY